LVLGCIGWVFDVRIGLADKVMLIASVYRSMPRNSLRSIVARLLQPIDVTRYVEFPYLLRFLRQWRTEEMTVLDVSSPFILAYILARKNRVVKTDINEAEGAAIVTGPNLSFQREDGRALSFADDTFDLVYSISVIEHIHDGYHDALAEMVRVARPGGIIYVTFPVARQRQEEWIEGPIYSDQYCRGRRHFFQYRFDERDVDEMLARLRGVAVLAQSVYWERRDGLYDHVVDRMRQRLPGKWINLVRDAWLQLFWGFRLLDAEPTGFDAGRSFGNLSIILRKGGGGD
jgi:SAM-dependent methyltransferase